MITYILSGETVLLDADKKHRYDEELKTEENPRRWNWGWYLRWGYSIVAMVGGVACIAAAGALTVASAGTLSVPALGLGAAGSALLTSGIKTGLKQWRDPNCTHTEFIKDAVVGAVQGAGGGAIGAVAAPAVAVAATGAAVGIAAGVGAATAASSHLIENGADLMATSGCLGTQVKQSISDARTQEEVFSWGNVERFGVGVALGAGSGLVAQGVAGALSGTTAASAAGVTDDAANVSRALFQKTLGGKPLSGGMQMVADAAGRVGGKAMRVMGRVAGSNHQASTVRPSTLLCRGGSGEGEDLPEWVEEDVEA
uniref:Uncharacterized protein n=1 Tax=Chromera velia CCMP2878 TaxID=1169474 RepID=A0A0G4GTZ1_9ALVE|eukprot:Cvel_736.t1-p1 / transcript=Cvel_736.t1 / gene=Cvel_736 / organism=Chromera_velia_CCMP2878 / gene_product=hypothetical protein / transcript_product=hypothetical protein / location=Cvel_scaffold23:7016-7948(-) / protein_length=311 / sequence_SO=supercontig / SO=protein_coding / is_pseudo=false